MEIVTSTAAPTVNPKWDSIFARQGIPELAKSDNSPPFNGTEFEKFSRHLGFYHRKITTGQYVLVLMDDYSNFPEVETVTSTAAPTVNPKWDSIFSRQGIPELAKSDNSPPFNGTEFEKFSRHLGFYHRKITPIWPQANGEVERFMAPLMKAIKATQIEQRLWKLELYNFLRQYRATPPSTTGISPAEALDERKLQVTLPELSQRIHTQESQDKLKHEDMENKAKIKAYCDKRRIAKQPQLQVGDTVLVRQHRKNKILTPFDPKPLQVVRCKSSMVTAKRVTYTITRNVSHYKRCDARISPLLLDLYNAAVGFPVFFTRKSGFVLRPSST